MCFSEGSANESGSYCVSKARLAWCDFSSSSCAHLFLSQRESFLESFLQEELRFALSLGILVDLGPLSAALLSGGTACVLASISPAREPASSPNQNPSQSRAVVLTLREKKAPASLFPIFAVFVQADANTWVHFSFCNEHTANEKKKRSLDDFSGREKENCLQVSEGLLCSQQRSGIFLVSISEHRVRGRE